ncbi:hypothetical protein RUM44_000618 [Polyplax serrata]|uniref:C2H2-type domain-containing protein n=1 Tax=Polyplax serrata TaxID=468196 RepID=A0ABR1B8K4_POLSC
MGSICKLDSSFGENFSCFGFDELEVPVGDSVKNKRLSLEALCRVERSSSRTGITCSLCNKRLLTKQGFSRHMKNHLGDRSQTCHICGKGFIEKKDISRHVNGHMEIHSSTRQYVCQYCGIRYSVRKYLRVHQRTRHPGMKTNVT